jgi:hypothetical protein
MANVGTILVGQIKKEVDMIEKKVDYSNGHNVGGSHWCPHRLGTK